MSTVAVTQVHGTSTALTISLASIAAGAGRLSTQVDNSTAAANKVALFVNIEAGTAPTAGGTYRVWLVRYDNNGTPYASEGLGTADAAVATEPTNAQFVGSIVVTNSTNTHFYGDFIIENLGYKWAVVVFNGTDQALHATGGNHYVRYNVLTTTITG